MTAIAPKFKELSTSKVWASIENSLDVICYFPDFKDDKLSDRQFMWNVLNTMKLFMTEELIEKALKNRSIENEDNTDVIIEISPEYLRILKNMAMMKVCFNIQCFDNYFRTSEVMLFFTKNVCQAYKWKTSSTRVWCKLWIIDNEEKCIQSWFRVWGKRKSNSKSRRRKT